jgi:dUTP pyrophosphatase
MKVRIKTSDWKSLNYETSQACGFDFKCSEEITIKAGEFWLIETGTVIETPEGYALQIQPRSSTFKNFGLIQTNSVGLVDRDYCWENDTIKFGYLNMRDTDVTIEKWTRIGQWIFLKIWIADFEVVEKMWNDKNRGWFWTTGNK